MSDPHQIHYKNLLLHRMNADDAALLHPSLERCALNLRMGLEAAGKPIEFVYFVEQGIGSVVARTSNGTDTEIGFIGFDGMTGSAIVMGDDHAVNDCYVQVSGNAFRIAVPALEAALSASPALRNYLLRYARCLHIQTGYTALVNARFKLEVRLARWLLMCHDRVTGDTLLLTHEFLSIMLGVRRPGVTVALQFLEGRGLVRANRGEITIRDRDGLLTLAIGAYGEPETEYVRLLGKIGATGQD